MKDGMTIFLLDDLFYFRRLEEKIVQSFYADTMFRRDCHDLLVDLAVEKGKLEQ